MASSTSKNPNKSPSYLVFVKSEEASPCRMNQDKNMKKYDNMRRETPIPLVCYVVDSGYVYVLYIVEYCTIAYIAV